MKKDCFVSNPLCLIVIRRRLIAAGWLLFVERAFDETTRGLESAFNHGIRIKPGTRPVSRSVVRTDSTIVRRRDLNVYLSLLHKVSEANPRPGRTHREGWAQERHQAENPSQQPD